MACTIYSRFAAHQPHRSPQHFFRVMAPAVSVLFSSRLTETSSRSSCFRGFDRVYAAQGCLIQCGTVSSRGGELQHTRTHCTLAVRARATDVSCAFARSGPSVRYFQHRSAEYVQWRDMCCIGGCRAAHVRRRESRSEGRCLSCCCCRCGGGCVYIGTVWSLIFFKAAAVWRFF